jgi:hypothetical protein
LKLTFPPATTITYRNKSTEIPASAPFFMAETFDLATFDRSTISFTVSRSSGTKRVTPTGPNSILWRSTTFKTAHITDR